MNVATSELTSKLVQSFVFFQGSYWACRLIVPKVLPSYNELEKDKRGYFCATLVGTLHAVMISCMTIDCVIKDPQIVTGYDFLYKSAHADRTVATFLGYVASDFMLAMYYRSRWNGWLENIAHHVVVLACYTELYYNRVGSMAILSSLLCEITTPFVSMRWLFAALNMKETKVYFYNGLIITSSWFVLRVLWYSWLGVKIASMNNQISGRGVGKGALLYFCYSVGLFLQYFWFYKILRGSIKVLFPKKNKDKKNQPKNK